MDPVIPADIGTALFILLFLIVGWQAGRWILHWLVPGALKARERLMTTARARTRRTVEDNSGDAGGMPTVTPDLRRAHGIYMKWKAGD